MSSTENEYEKQRLENIRANQALLDSLKLGSGGASALGIQKKPAPPPADKSKKRKSIPSVKSEAGPRRSSSRLLGLEADSEVVKRKAEEDAAIAYVERKQALKARHEPYSLHNLPEPISDLASLSSALASTSSSSNPKPFDTATSTADEDDEAGKAGNRAEVFKLKEQFDGLVIRSQARVTEERVFSMTVHPEKTKTLVFVGDKYGQLGIWDALAPPDETPDDSDAAASKYLAEGKHWKIQVHGKSSLSCMKVDPSDGKKLYTSSYDCTIRALDLENQQSVEVFSIRDSDYLISNFDMPLEGNEIWATDKKGGLSHCDLREGGSGRRRYEVGEGKKLGGVSVNPAHPWLVCTAGNDQHVRIWDVRHLSKINPTSSASIPAAEEPLAAAEGEAAVAEEEIVETWPTANILGEQIKAYAATEKGKGLVQGVWRHGKSCSSAVWDPWGRRLLTTSYDDSLRVWSLPLSSFSSPAPFTASEFSNPRSTIPHDCQTGRWLSILRAQWSANVDYCPHFTVGNMKRSLDVFAWSGELVQRLFDPEIITAVPAVTASHPGIVNTVVGGNGSGKCQVWGKPE
ncbi:WD40-repeat-containing domain protein [Mrakia frigida]|uniref:Cmr1p n=1 Tax=Mrakia frigida TaxID=29902 RepID=UPI003FCC211C